MSITGSVYRSIRNIVGSLGYNLVVSKKSETLPNHEPLLPSATLAPWLTDEAFNETYRAIKGHTLVDKYRCYELWQLVAETTRLHGALIEVGVWRGGTGALIAKKAKLEGIRETVYLCDTFTGVVKSGEQDSQYKGGEHRDTSVEIVTGLLTSLALDNTTVLKGMFPEETANAVSDNAFRFCHVDVDVYRSARDVVEWIWPKLVVGGIVVFDDYGFSSCDGVRMFVDEERGKQDRVVIHNLNGHAIIVKL